jgi:hypothetical protein
MPRMHGKPASFSSITNTKVDHPMNPRILPATLILSLVSSGALAQSGQLFGVPARFNIGPEAYRQNIKIGKGDQILQQDATLYGVSGGLRLQFSEAQGAEFSARMAKGEADSQLKSQQRVLVRGGKHNATDYELRGVYQYTMALAGKPLTASAGMGYLQQNKQLDKGSMAAEYYYATTGVATRLALGEQWSVAPRLNYQRLLSGKQHLNGGIKEDVRQKAGYGVELAADFNLKLADKALNLTPFYRYWNVNAASRNGKPSPFPASNTNEAGLKASLEF